MKKWKMAVAVWLLVGVLSGLHCTAEAATLRVSWDPNTEADLAGYRVQYRASSVLTWSVVDAGNKTQIDIPGILENVEYCATVTAYDASGNESAASDAVCEVLDTIPPAKVKGVRAIILKLVSWLKGVIG
jgi:hypothetical protein